MAWTEGLCKINVDQNGIFKIMHGEEEVGRYTSLASAKEEADIYSKRVKKAERSNIQIPGITKDRQDVTITGINQNTGKAKVKELKGRALRATDLYYRTKGSEALIIDQQNAEELLREIKKQLQLYLVSSGGWGGRQTDHGLLMAEKGLVERWEAIRHDQVSIAEEH